MSLKITDYTNEMKQQVIELICYQYAYNKLTYAIFFSLFYESDFQKDAIKIVALDGNKVIGFQSFFCWPYVFNNKTYNSFQSGNSIVDENYRGQGIFQKMLTHIYEKKHKHPIDFFIGFPVEASYKSFIKTKWENPFNLQWYITINNLFSILFPYNKEKISTHFQESQTPLINSTSVTIKLADNPEFIKWRQTYYKTKLFYYTFSNHQGTCQFGLKINTRKKIIRELIIGQFNTTCTDAVFITEAYCQLLKTIKKLKFITLVTIAFNENQKELKELLLNLNFKRTNKSIYFIIKDFSSLPEIKNISNWELYRGDLDTW